MQYLKPVIAGALLLGLTACGGGASDNNDRRDSTDVNQQNWSNIGYDDDVKVIEVEGVRCIVVDSDSGGVAITCPDALQPGSEENPDSQ